MIKNLLTLFLFSLFSWSLVGQCPSGDVVLSDQAEVDAFLAAYPNCTSIDGVLTIGNGNQSNDISDISGFFNLTDIDGNLRVGNTQLTNLNGLDNITSVNGVLAFAANPNLVSLQALSSVTSATGIIAVNNASLTTLVGIGENYIAPIVQVTILNNPLLTTCEVEAVCTYLDVIDNTANIANNGPGCDSTTEVEEACESGGGGDDTASALNFDGNHDYVALPDALRTMIPADLSVEAWFKAESVVGGSSIVHNLEWTANGDLYAGYAISMLGGDGGVEGIVTTADNGLVRVQYNDINLDQWYHVAMTYDGSMARLYIDGQEVNSMPATGAIDYDPIPQGFNIGFYEDINESVFFDGDIDEVRIWGRALSCFEIEQQYSCELSGSEQDLVAYYQFNQGVAEGDNTSITELTATTGPNGTLTGLTLMGTSSNFIEPGGVTTGASCNPVMTPSFDFSSGGAVIPPNSTLDIGDVMLGENGVVSIQIDAFGTSFSTPSSNNPLFSITDLGNSFNITFTPNDLGQQTATIIIGLEDCLGIYASAFEVTANGVEMGVSDDCPDNLVLMTQAEVDDFLVQYPNCDEVLGFIKIGNGETPTDIDDLTPLSNLTRVGGTVSIFYNPDLSSLDGLDNVVLIGGNLGLWGNSGLVNMQGLESLNRIGGSLNVHGNDNIIDFEGLNSLRRVGDRMDIESNFFLEDFSGLESLITVGGFMGISSNPFLNSLAGLSSLGSIGSDLHIKFNPDLTNIDGLSALASVDRDLVIESNGSLANVDGLSMLTSVGGNLAFLSNSSLTGLLGMSSLTSINGFLVIRSNSILTSLAGLENINPAGIVRLYIVANPLLSTCEVESVCSYLALPNSLASIAGNRKGCVSITSVEMACNDGAVNDFGSSITTIGGSLDQGLNQSEFSVDIAEDAKIRLYPNPTNGILQIRNMNAQLVVVFNAQGQRMVQFDNPGKELDMSTLSAGVYYLNFITAEGSITKRVVKVD